MKLISNQRILDLSIPRVMGIINITPDSFYDKSRYNKLDDIIDYTASMIKDGASIIDIGGESTRPGASLVKDEEEAARVIPVITALIKRFDVFISVDTSKALVILESAAAGAHLLNDVRSLSEPGSLKAAANSQLLICLMHMQGNPNTMQSVLPKYNNIIEEISMFFSKQITRCKLAGIEKTRLLLDPGFGFGKTMSHNYYLLSHLSNFRHFALPLLVGMSRKSMIGKLLRLLPNQCMIGSLACAVIAALQGVKIIRTHDVKYTMEVLRIVEATLLAKQEIFS